MMERARVLDGRRRVARVGAAVLTVVAALAMLMGPAHAHGGGRGEEVPAGVGFFYGTFDQSPNYVMLVGGSAEEFCEANPDDPFNGEPGVATQRITERKDGTVRIKLRSWSQPTHIYKIDFPAAPPWIEQVCADYAATGAVVEPFASGTSRVRSRVTISPDGVVDVFNAARGKVMSSDGTWYRVRGSADLVVVDGIPQGDPAEFVSFSIRKVGRWW